MSSIHYVEGRAEKEHDERIMREQARIERVSDFRLCLETLRVALEPFDEENSCASRDRLLETPEETLEIIEDTLLRVTELGLANRHEQEDNEHRGLGSASYSPRMRAQFRRCFVAAGLGVPGLLEAAFGDLTDWRFRPTEDDFEEWQVWDRAYTALLQDVNGRSKSNSPFDALGVGNSIDVTGSCPAIREVQCPAIREVRGACAPICGRAPVCQSNIPI